MVTGRADWAISYGERDYTGDGSVLVCVEAKRPSTFSSAAPQLVCYLAMCRYIRMTNSKINKGIHGFISDWNNYQFFLDNSGKLTESRIYNTKFPSKLRIVYNNIISQLEAVKFSTPTTTPIKGSLVERRLEALTFEDRVLPIFFTRPTTYMDEGRGDEPRGIVTKME